MIAYLMMTLLFFIGVFLIFIVLLQRGRGGGLAGALGGMGGQSAFGTKAGDVFTRITVVLAVIWIVLCAGSIPLLRHLAKRFVPGSEAPEVIVAPEAPDENLPGTFPPENQPPETTEPGAVIPEDTPAEQPAAATGESESEETPEAVATKKSAEKPESDAEKSPEKDAGENQKSETPPEN